MQDRTGISERRACQLIGLSRTVLHYEPRQNAANAALQERMVALAHERRRFGYRRLHALLRREGVEANHKRIHRLYREAGLMVRRRRKRQGVAGERQALVRPEAPNQVGSMDFVFDALSTGRRIKCLTVVDDFTKEPVTTVMASAAPASPGRWMKRHGSAAIRWRCAPIRGLNLPARHSTSGPTSGG